MTLGNSLLLVYIRLGISSNTKKKNENCSCLWGHQKLSQGFFYPNFRCLASKLIWVAVLGGFHWHQQSREYNFLYIIPADWDFAIVNHKTISTMKVYLYPYIQAINLNLRRRCGQTEIVCHCSLLMSLAPPEQSIQLLIGAEQQLLLDHTIN